MRILLLLLCFAFVNVAHCASYYWEASFARTGIWLDDHMSDDFMLTFWGSVRDSSSHKEVASLYDTMFVYRESGGVYIKQYDYTPMMVGHNGTWFIAYIGELISAETIGDFIKVPLGEWDDVRHIMGWELGDPSDFYLGFQTNKDYVYDDILRYGWFHLSIDDAMNVSLLDSGVGLYGESVLVGIGPIPEPAAGTLFILGAITLLLRRRRTEARCQRKQTTFGRIRLPNLTIAS